MKKFWKVMLYVSRVAMVLTMAFELDWMFFVLGDSGPDSIWNSVAIIAIACIVLGIWSEHMTDVYNARMRRSRKVQEKRQLNK